MLLLLCSLPKMHDQFKETLLYGRETLFFEGVQTGLSSKEMNEKFEVKVFGAEDDLVARSRPCTNNNREGRRRSKNGENTSFIKCYHCKKGRSHK